MHAYLEMTPIVPALILLERELQLQGAFPSQATSVGLIPIDPGRSSLFDQALRMQLLPTSTSTSTSTININMPLSLTTTSEAPQNASLLFQQAIAQEKARLIRSIMSYQQVAYDDKPPSAIPIASEFQRPHFVVSQDQPNPTTCRIVDAIGSKIRLGQPYVDVTELPGIEQVNDVPPCRTNRVRVRCASFIDY
jgi:hypothetical protein